MLCGCGNNIFQKQINKEEMEIEAAPDQGLCKAPWFPSTRCLSDCLDHALWHLARRVVRCWWLSKDRTSYTNLGNPMATKKTGNIFKNSTRETIVFVCTRCITLSWWLWWWMRPLIPELARMEMSNWFGNCCFTNETGTIHQRQRLTLKYELRATWRWNLV